MFRSTSVSNRSLVRRTAAAASVLGTVALAAGTLGSAQADATPAPTGQGAAVSVKSSGPSVRSQQLPQATGDTFAFKMVRSAGAVKTGCLPKAKATVTVTQAGPVEVLRVAASGLPKDTDFDFFVIQTPDAPFGLSWYQGDLESNDDGNAYGTFVGRFNEETFSVAPGVAPAPVVHEKPIKDADHNPATAPVHQYHLGFWFNSPKDAAKAGCGNAVTPFNGEHNAGTQAMSTRQFSVGVGPLGRIPS